MVHLRRLQPQASADSVRGFTLIEAMITVAIVGVLASLTLPDLLPMLERRRLADAAAGVHRLMQQAQWMALAERASHRVNFESGKVLLERKKQGTYAKVLSHPFPEEFRISANRWPSFGPYGFALSGTVTLDSERYQTKLIVSTVGRIRQTGPEIN